MLLKKKDEVVDMIREADADGDDKVSYTGKQKMLQFNPLKNNFDLIIL